jgi:NitT/TauT family transport system permease protein
MRREILLLYQPASALVAIIVAWQLTTSFLHVPTYLLPSPYDIWVALVSSKVNWAYEAAVTLREALSGFLLAVGVGLVIATGLSYSSILNRYVYPLVLALQLVPKVALAPIFYIMFGFGILPRVLLVFLISFFPIVINTVVGLNSLDASYQELLLSLGASKFQVFTLARFRNGLPIIFGGLRIAITLAVVGAVVAELVQSDAGLGYITLTALNNVNGSVAFAAVTVLTLVGAGIFLVLIAAERAMIPWYKRSRQVQT